MKNPLNVLHLEDSQHDADLVQRTLAGGGISCSMNRVQNRTDFITALERGGVDLVIADFSLPGFDAIAALEILRDKRPDVPCILVSGSVGEEVAVESLKSGATDYVLKDRLSRLVPAVRRAMKEAEDRHERRRLEEQIIQSQKMEVFGRLAAGVAHGFNNIIAVILGYSDLILKEFGADASKGDYIETIREAAERGAGLTRQLLIFSRKQAAQPVVLDLNKVVDDMAKMLRRLIDENIELVIVLGKEIGRAKVDAGHVWQVLMNLVVNARDAMPNGGKLTIATTNVLLAESYPLTHEGVAPGSYVMLSVSDTGMGMSEAVKERLFEAFFTTKPEGKGTGLGLATCQTIAKQCGGYIGVQSEVGSGTTFRVYFPRVDLPLDGSSDLTRKTSLRGGSETLLLVEEDPTVRELARIVLTGQGYEVLVASNSQDGLELAHERKGPPIRLVITDIVKPHLGGQAMSDSLRTPFPNLCFLFTSGYPDDAIMRKGALRHGLAFLSKPYTPATLVRKVRETLDKETPTIPLVVPHTP